MIDVKQLEASFQQATERAIKIHNALDIPYITSHNGQVVEMLHGEVLRVIEQESTVDTLLNRKPNY